MHEESTALLTNVNQEVQYFLSHSFHYLPFSFSHRDLLLTCLAAFHPVRLLPLSEMTIDTIEQPFKATESSVVLRIRGEKLKGNAGSAGSNRIAMRKL